jgi:dolichol-phosphate mannosyltransferase
VTDTLPSLEPALGLGNIVGEGPGIAQGETRLRLIKNSYGRGVVGAIRTGFDAAAAGPVLVLMADLSDDLGQVRRMLFKQLLSRLSGLTLCWFRGIPTHDATNAFKIHDRAMLSTIQFDSKGDLN